MPESPYAGTTVLPAGAGVRHKDAPRQSEHRPGGMLGGARVCIRYSSPHQIHQVTGVVLEFVSVPAPHLLIEYTPVNTTSTVKKIIFCSSIIEIDESG